MFEGELVGEGEDVSCIVGNGLIMRAAGRITLTVAPVVEKDDLKSREAGNVTGVCPHPGIAGGTCMEHDGEAVADNVVRKVQAGVDERSHLPSVAPSS